MRGRQFSGRPRTRTARTSTFYGGLLSLISHPYNNFMFYSRDVIEQRWTDYKKKKIELGESFESEYFGESKSARKHRLSFLGKNTDLK